MTLALVVVTGGVSLAQRFGVFEGAGAGIRVPPRDFSDGRFTVCKWMFRSVRSEPSGIGWSTDYPFGEINLLTRLSDFTKVPVSRDAGGDVNYWVVRLSDDQLFECPMLIGIRRGDRGALGPGGAALAAVPAEGRVPLGGRLLGHTCLGAVGQPDRARAAGVPDCRRRSGRSDPPGHVHGRQGQAGAQHLRVGRTGERPSGAGEDSPHANFRAIADGHGRIMVAMTHNTDIGDSMEREGDDPRYFAEYSPEGYALATNIALYALTH